MLSHKCKFSSLKSLTEFYTNSNRNYQDTVMEDDKFDRHYTGSILRNLIHVMYENEQLTLTNHELIELFTEDLGSYFDKATDEIDIITTILSTPNT
ncbi:unnamed protein product [Rotaria sordida]|uniref:Uncharacterized protein n=2 Tax=Rotaria sordida TaxID=392033 RepID=A0A820EDR0_9BILA|nr:unnamed protein product [Rotaria sordida]